MKPTARRLQWLIVPAVFLAFSVPWLFYCPDDLYIHLRFSQNLVELGQWSFNPGEPVAGATSPPWVLLIALFRLLGAEGVTVAKVSALITGLLTLGIVYWALSRSRMPRGLILLTTLAVGTSHWLTFWSASGMETPLPVLFLVMAVALYLSSQPNPWLLGSALGAATLARPDAIPASVVILLGSLVATSWGRRVRILGTYAAVTLSWPLISRLWLGTWLPITVSAKAGSGFDVSQVSDAILRTALVAASEMLPLAMLLVVALLIDGEIRRRWRCWLVPLVAAASYPVMYLVNHLQGGVIATGRYLVPWYVLLALASVLALKPWTAKRLQRRWVVAAVSLCILQSVVVAATHRPATLRYNDYHERTLMAAATYLRQNADRSAVVAARDIGVLGYVGQVHVLDLGGIVNAEAPVWAAEGRTFEEIKLRRPDFFINPKWQAPFQVELLEPYTRRVIFTHVHTDYRWTLNPGKFTITFREMDWDVPE